MFVKVNTVQRCHMHSEKMETIKPYLNRCGLAKSLVFLLFKGKQNNDPSSLMWSQSGVIIGTENWRFFRRHQLTFFSMIKPDTNDPAP